MLVVFVIRTRAREGKLVVDRIKLKILGKRKLKTWMTYANLGFNSQYFVANYSSLNGHADNLTICREYRRSQR